MSYLQTLHRVPRKKIFFVQTLQVDNFIRLLHLRMRERRRSALLAIRPPAQGTTSDREQRQEQRQRSESVSASSKRQQQWIDYELVLNLMGHARAKNRRRSIEHGCLWNGQRREERRRSVSSRPYLLAWHRSPCHCSGRNPTVKQREWANEWWVTWASPNLREEGSEEMNEEKGRDTGTENNRSNIIPNCESRTSTKLTVFRSGSIPTRLFPRDRRRFDLLQ